MNTLYEGYMKGLPAVRAQFAEAPESLFDQPLKSRRWASGISEGLNRYQSLLGVEKAPARGDEPVIITGQQPGLFTGPLYTLYKAITAVQLAEEFEQRGQTCVPVFWTAGDDHDFEEVRTAWFLNRRHEVLPLTYQPDDARYQTGETPLYRVPLSRQIHTLIDAAADACPNSEQTPAIRDFLHETAEQAVSVSHWFSMLMSRLFSHATLRIFEPHLPEARQAAMPIFRKEIETPLQSTRLLIETGMKLDSLGFSAPIQRDPTACNFFVEVDGRRCKVIFEDGRYSVGKREMVLSTGEMLDLLDTAPERFSANVALRPIVQQFLFSPAAYVAGPGEIAYWAQLKPLFSFFDLEMPVVYPRIRAVLTTIKINKILRRHDLSIPDVLAGNTLLSSMLAQETDAPTVRAFSANKSAVQTALEHLVTAVQNADNTGVANKASETFRRTIEKELDRFERALLYADKEKRAVVEERLARLSNTLLPGGKPQERVFSVFSFLFEYGFPLIETMLKRFNPAEKGLQELEL